MRRVGVVILLAILLLAGCTSKPSKEAASPDAGAAEPTRREPAHDIAFTPKTLLGSTELGAEPSIAVAPDGTVYVTTPLAMWRGDDNGTKWTDLGGQGCFNGLPLPFCPGAETSQAPPGLTGGGDADVWVTPDGRVHWLGLFGTNKAGESVPIPYQYSDDRGQSWSDAKDLSNGTGADREWITSRPDGTLFAAWRDAGTIRAARSLDNGLTWTEPRDVTNDTRQGGIAVDPTGNALALAHDLGGIVAVAHSFDEGETWESVVVAENRVQGQVFPVTAYDGGGTLYLAYATDIGVGVPDALGFQRPFESPSVFLHVSHDKGLTWGPAIKLNGEGTTAWFPWLAAGSAGNVVAVWYQNDKGLPRYATDEVYVMSAISTDADFDDPTFVRARVSPEPIHQGPECRETPPCTRSLLDFFEVAVHPDGSAVVAWSEDPWPVPRIDIAYAKMSSGPDLWDGAERP